MKHRSLLAAVRENMLAVQDGKFFKALAAQVQDIRDDAKTAKITKGFYELDKLKKMQTFIFDGLGLDITFLEGLPAIYLPRLDNNHVFFNDVVRDMFATHGVGYADVRGIMKATEQKVVAGEVDLATCKVSGVFSKIELRMFMPRDMFVTNTFTPEEVASVMCHEFGHAQTTMLMLGQILTTNVWLTYAIAAQGGQWPAEKKKVLFKHVQKELNMSDKEAAAMESCKDKVALTTIMVGAGVRPSTSSTNVGVYDTTTCEAMADNFAMRMGAGAHLSTALHKLHESYGMVPGTVSNILIRVLMVFMQIYLNAITFGLWSVLVIGLRTREAVYDDPWSRFRRMRNDLIVQLQNTELPKEELERLIADAKKIDEIAEKYPRMSIDVYDRVAMFFRPGFKREVQTEFLQKSLEELSANDLYLQSQRFNLLSQA